jgi:glutamate carboxypeptidase
VAYDAWRGNAREQTNNEALSGGEITFEDKYPAMAVTDGKLALLKLLNGVNRDLNMEAMEALDPSRRGAGDISFVAP